jgi:hypothetical protein
MSQQAIIKVGHMRILAPSVKAGTDLIALLGRCTEVETDYPEDPETGRRDYSTPIYKQRAIKLEMEVLTLKPHVPKPAPKSSPPMRRAKALPAPVILELPYHS